MSPKQNNTPRGIDLNPSPMRPARLSRRAVIAIYVVGMILASALAYGFYRKSQQNAAKSAEAPQRKITPATTAGDDINRTLGPQASTGGMVPSLAMPPVTGDSVLPPVPPADRVIVRQPPVSQPVMDRTYHAAQQQSIPQQTPEEAAKEAYRKLEQEAIAAPSAIGSQGGIPASQGSPLLPMQSIGGGQQPSQQAQVIPVALAEAAEPAAAKLAFLESAQQKLPDHYLRAMRTGQLSPYEIKAGWEIPAILEQSLNSDIPGEIKAMVREHVYDTATGRHLLIPQGARVLGKYNSRVDYGQDGLQVIYDRVIYPDGSSLDLGAMNGLDAQGRAGLRHDVDNHYKKIFGTAALTSLFSAALAISQRNQQSMLVYPSASDMASAAIARDIAMTGQQITRKNINIPPTIKVPLGYTFTVRVNKDILFDGPYRPSQVPRPSDLPVARMPGTVAGR